MSESSSPGSAGAPRRQAATHVMAAGSGAERGSPGGVLLALLLALVVCGLGRPVLAQSPIMGIGAMQPAKGHFYARASAFYRQFDGNESTQDRNVQQGALAVQVAYALLSNLSVSLDVPIYANDLEGTDVATGDSSAGFGDMTLLAKWRFWQLDTSPTDTLRLGLLGGLQIPGGTPSYMDSTEEGWNPLLGVVFSAVQGRHGGNASLLWEFNTEGSGQPSGGLRYDLSYLFRLAPATFGEESSHAAWYLVAELNGLYETNGNSRLLFSPGLMYEATWFLLDVNVSIPVAQDLKNLPDMEVAVGVGLRVTF